MKFLITSDFYTDFGIIETESKEEAEKYIIAYLNNEELPNVNIIASSDDISTIEAQTIADETLYISDYESEE